MNNLNKFTIGKTYRERLLQIAGLCLFVGCSGGAFAQSSIFYGTGAGNTEGAGNCQDAAFGYYALATETCTTGSGNTAMGYTALYLNTAVGNTAFGASALYYNSTATQNTAIGYVALESNHVSLSNTAVGYKALQSNDSDNKGTSGYSTALGSRALASNVDGYSNTATGAGSLTANTSGYGNTAAGTNSMVSNTTGNTNSAFGWGAMYRNLTAANNTSIGVETLNNNDSDGSGSAHDNTAIGANALQSHVDGQYETAIGSQALYSDTTGYDNVAIGAYAMNKNTTGYLNVALGNSSLTANTDGYGNFALGTSALVANVHGCNNVALGTQALAAFAGTCLGATTPGNIAIGYYAGQNITGNYNIDIGSTGLSADVGVTRIGFDGLGDLIESGGLAPNSHSGTTAVFISGIYNAALTGTGYLPVYVNQAGQLGTSMGSSERFKTDIVPIPAEMVEKLSRLRPVTFHYKTDPSQALQYGLIAEEVAKVYPELVIRDRDGNIASLHYEQLAPMLLSGLQQQQRTARDLEDKIQTLEQRTAAQAAQIADLEKRQEERLAAQSEQLRELTLKIAALSSEGRSATSVLAQR